MNSDLKRVGLVFDSEGNANFVKTLQQVNASLRENYNQFKINQAEWNNSTSVTEKLTKQQEYLTERYDIQSDKIKVLKMQLEELNSSEEKNEKAIAKKEKELAQAEIQLKKYGTQLNDVNSKLASSVEKNKELVESLTTVGNKIENVGKKASVLSGAFAAGLTASAKTAIDFESAFAGVEKTVDATEEQLANLKQGIRDLAKQIPASTTEISAVAEAAGQLGIQTDNILDFTKAMVDLGESTNLSSTEAADALARFANITGMSQKDFDKLGSTIVDLGNHCATTESEIVQMGLRIAGAGKTVGMSEADIMGFAAALSSVGIEAEMGGSAISKMLIKIESAVAENSSALKDYAKVAGLTAEEFKQAWEKDATGAMVKFIEGLGNVEKNGGNLITTLNDLDISEVRLRDTMLRLANSSELFNDTVALGNKAWDENNALSNEASKRYNTLKSKLEIVKNKLLDNVITIGNKLMPVVEKILDKVSKWTDNLSKLNDNQIETILKIGGMVVAAGPLLTILGKIITGIGDTVGTFSKFNDALKVASGTMTTTDTTVGNLAKVIGKMTTPVGLAIEAVGLLGGAIAVYKSQSDDGSEATKRLSDEIQNNIDSYNKLKEAQENQASSKLIEIDNTKDLYNELTKITDENGKIKQGYETRANFIVNELQKGLGIEIQLTDGVIKNYQDLQTEISKTISLKRANTLLDLSEEKYKNSLTEKDNVWKQLSDHMNELEGFEKKLADKKKEYERRLDQGATILALQVNGDINRLEKNIEQVKGKISEEQEIYQQHLKNITDYEIGSSIVLSNNIDDINQWANNTQIALNKNQQNQDEFFKNSLTQYTESIDYYEKLYQEAIDNEDEAAKKALENQISNEKEKLNIIIQSMLEQTSAVNENSPQIIEAWVTLAKTNKDKYLEIVSGLPNGLKRVINDMTGASSTSLDQMGSVLNKKSEETKLKIIDPFNDNSGVQKMMNNFLSPMSSEMDNYSPLLERKAGNIASNILNKFNRVFDIHSPSRETKKIFKNLMLGSEKGIEAEENNLYAQVDNVAENVLEGLNSVNSIPSASNYYNTSSNNIGLSIDYNQLYLCVLKALNNCKIALDEDGFIRFIDDRIREVM